MTEDLVAIGHLGAGPDLSLSLENVLVTWSDNDTISPNPFPNVGYVISQGGSNWSSPAYVFPHRFPGLEDLASTIYGDSIYVAYVADDRDSTGYFPVRFSYSENLGQFWSEAATIGHCPQFNNNLRMAKCGGSIYVFWSGNPIPPVGHPEIIGVVSHDGGQSWTDEIQLSSEDYHSSQRTCITCDSVSGKVAVGWMEAGYPGDLHLRITTDGGYSWGDILQATSHHMVASPSMVIISDTIWAVWSDRDPSHGWHNCEIAFSQSTDRGLTWDPYQRLTFADGWSYSPWISYDNGKLHIVWWDNSRPPHLGNEIYYKRYTPDPTAIIENRAVLLEDFSLTAHPNPFNSSCVITVSDLDIRFVEVYDIGGRRVESLPVSHGQAVWKPMNHSSGIYFTSAKGRDNKAAVKLLYLK
ncbi:MAG: exo-alpha-sialidase [Candidatus Zixiibacteriota bacterium]|nr:MAG: exo-alpha-sialidase [candidate division Zixibacteria bacterium]